MLLVLSNFTSRRADRRDLVYAASAAGSLYLSPLLIIAHAIRAILLASAIAPPWLAVVLAAQ
jgi:hypothetical protein